MILSTYNRKVSTVVACLIFLCSIVVPVSFVSAEAVVKEDIITIEFAKVISVQSAADEPIPGIEKTAKAQMVQALVLEGEDSGKTVEFLNDYIQLSPGQKFYVRKTVFAHDSRVVYSLSDPYRLTPIYVFVALFVLLVVFFGGKQGTRGLISLIGSLLLILYVLLPGILAGYSPTLLSIAVASLIIVLGSYITHGFNRATTSAVIGMILTVAIVGLLAKYAVVHTLLTGFDSEEAVYLNINTQGTIDFAGLLLGGMIIGLLGVLYDAAIGQAVSVEELHRIAPHVSRRAIYTRALRIGREHIGALVDTLAIAYVGVSLPLLLLFATHDTPILQLINRENFAAEIMRTMVGSIGLVLAVPITTLVAVFMLVKKSNTDNKEVEKEIEELEHYHHRH